MSFFTRFLLLFFGVQTVSCAQLPLTTGAETTSPLVNKVKQVSKSSTENKLSTRAIRIKPMGLHEIRHGQLFEFQPDISGPVVICRKDMGHDDVQVDPVSGKISWDTSKLKFGRGFHVRIKCSNYHGSAYAAMVVHVDKTGTSRLRVAGRDGMSPYIGRAGESMRRGDTLVIPDGFYPVSVTADESFENAFKRTAPPNGKKTQFTTVISETPGGVTVSGEAHDGIGKQKNAFQLAASQYVAIVGFVIKDVQRESFTTVGPGKRLLVEFVGAQGAGTWGFPCRNFQEAKKGQCSNAGMRVNQGSPLIQGSYNWGHNRYGIMTRSTKASVTRRSLVRLDEHRGDQPYGGFSDYCDKAHLSQDNIVFDSLAHAAPHYKNYAGLAAYPATGCQKMSAKLSTTGLLAVNNKLSLSLMDSKAGPVHHWRNIVSYDSEGTCTPQKKRCGAWLLQAAKRTEVSDSFFGKARGFEGSKTIRPAFDPKDVVLADSVILKDVPGFPDKGEPPRYLPQSQLYFNGRSDTFYGDAGYDQLTTTRRWPIPGEDIIAANMRSYHNSKGFKVGGGEIGINGDRGAVAKGQSMSEYFWGYTDRNIPPLVVRVKKQKSNNWVLWEHFSGEAKSRVTGWQVVCVKNRKKLARLPVEQLRYVDSSGCNTYGVQAVYGEEESGIAYQERAQ